MSEYAYNDNYNVWNEPLWSFPSYDGNTAYESSNNPWGIEEPSVYNNDVEYPREDIDISELDKLNWHNCSFCEERFLSIDRLKSHMDEHMKNEQTNITSKRKDDPSVKIQTKRNLTPLMDHTKLDRTKPTRTEPDYTSPALINVEEHAKPYEVQQKPPQIHLGDETELSDCAKSAKEQQNRYELLKRNVKISVNLEGEPTFTCKLCVGKSFKKLMALRNHMRIHEMQERECYFCSKKFLRPDAFQNHLRTHTTNLPYTCNICKASFSTYSSLQSHKRSHTIKLDSEDVSNSEGHIEESKPNLKTSFQCGECNKMFACDENLRIHLKSHSGERPFKCPTCDKRFRRSTDLNMHIRVHTGEKPYKCELCDYATKQSQCLVTHIRTHTGERPHKCDICERAFSEKTRLVTHYRTHTGERPYKCPYCGSAFTRSDNLRGHMRIHTGYKPHKCDICGKTFAQKTTLKTHKKIHSKEMSYECELCDKKFRLPNTLAAHMRIHAANNGGSNQCQMCDESFRLNRDLIKHVELAHSIIKEEPPL